MRALWLAVLCSVAAAGDDPDPRLVGDWGLNRFLDPAGYSMWIGFRAGSKTQTTTTTSFISDFWKSQERETRLVKVTADGFTIRLRTRKLPKKGKRGNWKTESKEISGLAVLAWKVEKLGATNYKVLDRVIRATQIRVTVTRLMGQSVWKVTATKDLGVLEAVRLRPSKCEWALSRLDKVYKVGKSKLTCREYVYEQEPASLVLPVVKRRLILCKDVPGYIVRLHDNTHIKMTEERLASFQGKRVRR